MENAMQLRTHRVIRIKRALGVRGFVKHTPPKKCYHMIIRRRVLVDAFVAAAVVAVELSSAAATTACEHDCFYDICYCCYHHY